MRWLARRGADRRARDVCRAAACHAELLEGRTLLSVSLVKDVSSYIGGNSPVGPGGYVYYAAYDEAHGYELWRTDGTTAGTALVADINPGSGTSYPSDMINVNDVLYFWADDGTHGRELWRSDGTAGGTRLVADLWPGTSGSINYQVMSEWAGWEMPMSFNVDPSPTQIGGTLFFAASAGTDDPSLWFYRSGMASPQLVPDTRTGGRVRYPHELVDSGGRLYFSAYDEDHGAELWVAEWTGNYATMVRDINPGFESSTPAGLTDVDGTLYFFARSEAGGAQLWKSDSSYARTVPVSSWTDEWPLAASVGLVRSGSSLYYVLTDRDMTRWDMGKYTVGGSPSLIHRFASDEQPQYLTEAGGALYFRVGEPLDHDADQDWNDPGSVMIEAFADGLSSTSEPTFTWDASGGLHVEYGSSVPDYGYDPYAEPTSYELWKTAGTAASTSLIGSFQDGPFDLANVNGTVYFSAKGELTDTARLWRTTPAGAEIVPGLTPEFTPDARGMKSYNGRLLFTTDLAPEGTWITPNALWVLDPSKDFYEENDSKAAVDARTEAEPYSPNLGLVAATRTLTDLSTLDDTADWYRFRIEQAALAGAQVQISFTHAQGNLDLIAYRADGTTSVGYSRGTTNTETVSLAGLAAGTYYIRVYGQSNPSYRLDLTIPIYADRFESNNTFATATNLGVLGARTEAGLTFHAATDVDYFRFTALSTAVVNLVLTNPIDGWFSDSWEFYNASQQEFSPGWAQYQGNQVTTAFQATAGQTYYIRINCDAERYATGLPYSLSIDVGSNPGRISGTVFQDHNADGARDSTESPRQFAAVYVDLNGDGIWQSANEPRTTSAPDGSYSFNLPYGAYIVRQDPWGGYAISTPEGGSYQVELTAAMPQAAGCDFGIYDTALVQAPYGGGTNRLPIRIEAEDYDEGGLMVAYDDMSQGNAGNSTHRNDDVDLWLATEDGTSYVGGIEAGDWLEYTIDVPAEGDYDLELRVAGFGGQMRAFFNGVDRTGAIAIPNTDGWENWTTLNRTPVHLLAGKQVMRLAFDAPNFNLNWIRLSGHHTPFSGTAPIVPGTLQAEDFDQGAEGVAYHDAVVGNAGWQYRFTDVDIEQTTDADGGYNVGYVEDGEWLDYTFDAANPGLHSFALRVASPAAGGTVRVLIDGVDCSGAVAIPATGSWQTWTTISAGSANLAAGLHVMRLVFASSNGYVGNVNWIQVTRGANVVQGTSAANTFRVRTDATGNRVQVFVSSALLLPPKSPTYDWPLSSVDRLEFQGLDGNDTLIIDSSHGNPIPAGGFSFDGGIGTDVLRYIGTSGNDSITVTTTEVRSGAARYAYSNIEQVRVETGAGDDALTVSGRLRSLPLFLGGTGTDRLTLSNGAYVADYDLGSGSENLDLVVVNTELRIAAAQHLHGLTLAKDGTAQLLDGGDRTLVARALLIEPGSVLDLNDNTLVLRGLLADSPENLEDLQYLFRVFREGWGITGHTPGGESAMAVTALLNQQDERTPILRMAGQQSVWSEDILVKALLHGDSDLNGRIDGRDYFRMDEGFLARKRGYVNGDVDSDGAVDGDDFYLIDSAFLTQRSVLAAGAPSVQAASTPFCTTAPVAPAAASADERLVPPNRSTPGFFDDEQALAVY